MNIALCRRPEGAIKVSRDTSSNSRNILRFRLRAKTACTEANTGACRISLTVVSVEIVAQWVVCSRACRFRLAEPLDSESELRRATEAALLDLEADSFLAGLLKFTPPPRLLWRVSR
jgi:hypothetical protein